MHPIRLGAVGYLNARPLVYGLESKPDRFSLRFDVPSKCAALLHENSIDVGLIPSIEYLRGNDLYCIVPDLGIVSEGPVKSVALFCSKPVDQVRSIAVDTSSRTSNVLLHVLCEEDFGVDPEFVPMAPNAFDMLRYCDAALLIGDAALFLDHDVAGLQKVDLGERWTAITGLPFVWAFWAGRRGAASDEAIAALLAARDAGVAAADRIAEEYCGPARAALGRTYLRDNIRYGLGDRELAGLQRFYELAHQHELVDAMKPIAFF
jgi:chorismate dehydratase